MLKRALIVVALLASALAAGLPPLALAQGSPVYITTAPLALSERIKFPHVDTLGSEVLVAGNAERSVVRLWSKPDTATSFGAPRTIGAAEATPDYTTASIFVTDAGVVHYAWTHERDSRIYLRTKRPGDADFGPRLTVYGTGQPFEVEVAANEDGVFVFWREPGQPVKYRRSPDGVNWSVPIGLIGGVAAEPFLDVAAGPGRRLALAFYRNRVENDNDYLQCYLAIWNGTGFTIERVPFVIDRSFANPSVALRPDGGWVVAARSTERENGLGAGVYVADRLPSGNWDVIGRLARGDTLSTTVDVDPLGNTHLFWVSREAGPTDLYYIYRRAGEGYGGQPPASQRASPLRVAMGSTFITNVRAAASLRDRSYGHAVTERFEGGPSEGQYFLFGLPVTLVGAAGISIEGGAPLTSKSALSVSFSGITGTPTGVRWSWGAPPAADAPFSPFSAASPTITVPLPAGADPNCSTLTLYTQLQAGSAVQQGASSDSIVLDQAVQAEFFVAGPPPAIDVRYTGSLSARTFVYGGGDCAGLATTSVSGPLPGGSRDLPVAGKGLYGETIELAGDAVAPGPLEFGFLASDLAGNTMAAPVTRTLIYDPVPPTLLALAPESAATLVPNPEGTAQLRLALDGLDAVDPGGVVAGLAIQVTGPPVDGVPVESALLRVPFTQMDQVTTAEDGTLSVRETLSLTQFFAPEQLLPGTYTFTISVVDGAGNVSAESETRSEILEAITYPVWVPLARR